MDGSQTKCNTCGTRLCAGALGFSFGITWALGILLLGIMAWKFNYGTSWLTSLSSIYVGYEATPKGIGIGVLWGFVDGFVGGLVIAWIYNLVAKCCACRCCKPAATV